MTEPFLLHIMQQNKDMDDHQDDVFEGEVNASANGQEERSECIDILRQLLDDADMNTVSKHSLIQQLEEECGETLESVAKVMPSLSTEYEAICHEIDAFVRSHRSQSSSANLNTSLDTYFLVDTALAKITGKQECSGKEVGICIIEQ